MISYVRCGSPDKLEDAQQRYRFLSAEELLWALSSDGDETVADFGSGTGFYTDDVAPAVDQVYAVDIQEAVHDYYREKGVLNNEIAANTNRFADLQSLVEEQQSQRPAGAAVLAASRNANGVAGTRTRDTHHRPRDLALTDRNETASALWSVPSVPQRVHISPQVTRVSE